MVFYTLKKEGKARPDKKIKIRLSETELIKLNALTKESGRSIKSYLRSLINEIVPCNKPNLEYLEILSELRHIGSNMNQIALIANKSSYIDYK
ncbi:MULTISPECIES: plasmid mobilization protein [Faecalicoccus]|uniref:Plasmid mobilization relaxosome protein MobC n=1 Tax=Faecalicoccus pleomorphus TaxID=1323 RepID=A0AAW6CUM8_9FIRM|nr:MULTISPECIES: plasmid mobilization relaxosome protein MobC [Faecalicoccus]MDB7981090.1 plasmid mobilization relaxosome protein MobC [Faecalicoccus pleomorphus]MDB7983363.1 plasmid mobilization relaxosome protein MobC [Faecalicoccus pleomorphus]MDY4277911.1 plasmid mobilization relaxosome protein MobC [Faecalicoccus sp.]